MLGCPAQLGTAGLPRGPLRLLSMLGSLCENGACWWLKLLCESVAVSVGNCLGQERLHQ